VTDPSPYFTFMLQCVLGLTFAVIQIWPWSVILAALFDPGTGRRRRVLAHVRATSVELRPMYLPAVFVHWCAFAGLYPGHWATMAFIIADLGCWFILSRANWSAMAARRWGEKAPDE